MRRDTKTGAADFFVFARDYLRTYMSTIRGLSAKTGSSPDRVGLAVSLPGVRGVGQLGDC